MTVKPMKPIKKPPKQLNIEDTESLKCDACGNYTFIKSYFIRRVSPLMSPTGQEAMIPIEVFACGNCGKVPDKMIPKGDE
jgi:hypothetical protein|tara:strand:+ start:425 stop:664 length:240 start_codon:yes stop_codon:yes gene_type:complete